MYAKLHWTSHIQKLKEFSDSIKSNCKEEKIMKTTNISHFVIQRYLLSLKEYKFNLYSEYTTEEKSIFIPHTL